jgi:hypothetical protein
MNDIGNPLADINSNPLFDLKSVANYLFEQDDDDWPNPYLHVNIDSCFHDIPTFISKFKNNNNPIFISLNVQSLLSKHAALSDFISGLLNENISIFVIAVQEIWSIPYPELIKITGYRFVCKTRGDGRGGGVGFYLRDDLSYNIISPIPFIDSQFEYIALETTLCNKKYYLCNIYRAPNNPLGDSFRDLIEAYN